MSREKDTILIVEDDPAIARLLQVYLVEKGYHILMANRGDLALEICRVTPPDLILLDVRLPDMSGYDVGIALRAAPDTQNIPIVVLTAFSERTNRLTAHNVVRAEYFLGKPFDIEEVYSVIRNQLSEGRRKGQYHPITNLPTGEMVNAQLRSLLASDGWTLALIRISGFEHFTQFYGVVVGENLLKFTALLLSEVLGRHNGEDDFVGQMVVGPYFLVVSAPARIEAIAADLIAQFDEDVKLHYDYRHRQQGGLEIADPGGQLQRHPLMSLAIAVLSHADGPFRDIRELTETAEFMLQRAAQQAGTGEQRSVIIRGR